MSEWITDRRPTLNDCNGSNSFVYNSQGVIVYYGTVELGEAWKPIPNCEPYVKPKRYKVVQLDNAEWAILRIADDKYVAHSIIWNAREAAERIAAIYEEVMP